MPTKAELQAENSQFRLTVKVLEERHRQAVAALKKYQEIFDTTGIDVWRANDEKPTPCICVSLPNQWSINIYPADGPAQGFVVYDETKLAFVSGLIPAELMMEEIAYVRKNG